MGVWRLEKRSDLSLSTLRNYVEAVGGRLMLVAQFPHQEPIAIGALGDIAAAKENKKTKRRAPRWAMTNAHRRPVGRRDRIRS
jgi:hypothetical protein